MEELITIEMLTEKSVSVKKERFIVEEGERIKIGNPHRKVYENNDMGRQEVIDELTEHYQRAIFAIWGVENAE